MSQKYEDFTALIARARQGESEAEEELVKMFGAHVLAVVRKHLPRRVRPIYDSTDLTQEVWADFFDKALPEQSFSTPEQVTAYLGKMAQNRAADTGRHHLVAQRANLRREREFSTCPHAVQQVADPRPGPAQLAADHDEWEQLLLAQPTFMRRVLKSLQQGHGSQQTAKRLGVSVRTVRRAIRLASRPMAEAPEKGVAALEAHVTQ